MNRAFGPSCQNDSGNGVLTMRLIFVAYAQKLAVPRLVSAGAVGHMRMIRWFHPLAAWTALAYAALATCYAQNPQTNIEELKKLAPKVFLDCSYCDVEYITTEIGFVNYVRDRKEAQIHVLITTQSTGGGGTEYTLAFSGQKEFAGKDDVLKYVSLATDTADERRKGLTGMLKMGLLAYAARTPIASRISISMTEKARPTSANDRWNFWVFSLSVGGSFSGEVSQRYSSLRGSFSANRVTPSLKIRSSVSANKYTDRFSYQGESIVSTSQNRNFSFLTVKSINDHWSAGGWLNAGASTYSNTRYSINPAPAIEFDLYPYSESTRRQLRFLYKPGYYAYRYREETIFDKMSERLWGESFSTTLELKEKWGSISGSAEAFHYFNDWHKNHLEIYGDLSVRLFKGLSFNMYGSFSRIHDQLSLAKGEATLEEVLLRRRQLETSFSYYGSIGFSYTFGSIYSNVVNPRFTGY